MTVEHQETRLGLVTGATGYVGSNVVTELLDRGWAIRTLSRSRDKALSMPWGERIVPEGTSARAGQVEVVQGDASAAEDVKRALSGAHTAWYLLHSMSSGDDFMRDEKQMAETFGAAARAAGIRRIVFLGGLHPDDEELSEHLASRVAVGEILMDTGVPTAALQAGVVLGAQSSSFQMLRHLSERLPGAIGPAWIQHEITPISVRDAVFYLASAADLPEDMNRTFDIGGPDTLPYIDMMKRYARTWGKIPRVVITAPVTTPQLASYWISLVTTVDHSLISPLISSLLHDTVLKERDLETMVGRPPGGNQSFEDAVHDALDRPQTRRWTKVFTGVSLAVGACAVLGSTLTDPKNSWYKTLELPSWQPPAVIFPWVWTTLYADIAAINALTIADLLENDDRPGARRHAAALGVNLALNAGWPGMFFRSKKPAFSTVWAAALTASSIDLVRRAHRSSPERGVLLAPYAAWSGFATVLNGAIARLNRPNKH
ncbi:tryptophan-rich sensory protein [Kocuria sp. TGY1127_2]|uniref:tryptophan-rich sensory protein n=1 Tax=Kocuria sp. TGY1127_2 TaxID=2711328 RepID=UPI0015BA691E|nr:tryptophan-rich sensory protein [Kocuria sp. TGY1127_2]